MRWFLLHWNRKNEKLNILKISIPQNITDTRNLWTKNFFKLLRSNALSPPVPCFIFFKLIGIVIYMKSVLNLFLNEPRHWQHVLLCQTCHNCATCHYCVTFYCNTKSYCPITLNQNLFYVFIRMCDSLFIVGADNRPIYQGRIEDNMIISALTYTNEPWYIMILFI